ncbi:MAG: hypothetical protein BWX88_01323 [Planctomycetes bacterium ADurb.Bin126]|nr:MAG: hypothetical protein BWX88_01323 [Planctomycetes bacterium ADurb.Bin126]HOD80854.1 PmoA family protein [Phycisphaerae bacterium]HQL74822.1 PmoA family protein [Phycisphaerae bacterium]
MRTVVYLLLIALAAPLALAQDILKHEWKKDKDCASLVVGGQTVYTYKFAADEGYPYIHPVSVIGGPVLSAFSPADHKWHRGLWWSWKFLNGVNYWEFAKSGKPDGQTRRTSEAVMDTDKSGAMSVIFDLEYSRDGVVLREGRCLLLHPPRADGSYAIDWASTFSAKDKDVVFERTDPAKASWGGYGGLGFRAVKSIRQINAIDSEGRSGKAQTHGKEARWMDFSGVFGEKGEKDAPAGVAIFDHPQNPRSPTPWYVADSPGMAYFAPAFLFKQPFTLKAGESFTLRYRVLVHPGMGDKDALEKEYRAFAK